MKIYFSNRKLWHSYSIICIIMASVLFLFLFLFYKFILIVLMIFILSGVLIYLAHIMGKFHNKMYLEISKDQIKIYSLYKNNDVRKIKFSEVVGIRKSGHLIKIRVKEEPINIIKLKYICSADTKKLINYLQFNPSIDERRKML